MTSDECIAEFEAFLDQITAQISVLERRADEVRLVSAADVHDEVRAMRVAAVALRDQIAAFKRNKPA